LGGSMRGKSAVLLLLALACGLVAAIGVTQVIRRDSEPVADQGDTRSIIVATQDITPGELITPQMLKLEPWPKEKLPEDCLSQIEKVEGCRAGVEIYQGEPILEKKLLGKGFTRRTATDYIPNGYRVVGVKVDMVSGGGLIQPGDRVDVLVHFTQNVRKGIPENRTQTILQDIKVFAVDDTFKIDPAADEEDSVQAKVIQLQVTPEEAETLVLAQQLGKVRLVMRPPGDNKAVRTKGKTPAELLGLSGMDNRPREAMDGNQPSGGGSGGMLGFLDNLRKGPPQDSRQPVQPTGDTTWIMRVLAGPELSDVVMQEVTEPSGEHVWRVGYGGGPTGPGPSYGPDVSAPTSSPRQETEASRSDDASP